MRRFARISRDGSQVDIAALASVEELRGNPFVARAFALFDSRSSGSLSIQEFTKAIDVLGHLNNTEQQLMCTALPQPGPATVAACPDAGLLAVLFQMLDMDSSGSLDEAKLVNGLRTVAGQSLGSDHLREVHWAASVRACCCARILH